MNNFKTYKDCPDRTLEPNCHETCEGYKYRLKEAEKLKEVKRKERAVDDFKVEAVEKTIAATKKARKRW